MYKNKCFKWGYFPETKTYNVEDLLKQKENEKIEIIWVGRFIKEKHPEYVVKLAQKLKEKNEGARGIKTIFSTFKDEIDKNIQLGDIEEVIIPEESIDDVKKMIYIKKNN